MSNSAMLWLLAADTFGRVVESIKAEKRLPEARFANLKLAAKGQKSVLGMFKVERNSSTNG